MDNIKIMGNSVATTMPFPDVPKKISDLVDDTIENPVAVAHSALQTNNANEAIIANKAIFDNEGNMIHITYATKAELTEAIGEALEGDY